MILKFNEYINEKKITIDLEKGDVILTGRFKNKKRVVKKFGKDKNNQPTVNDKPMLNFRIKKLMNESVYDERLEHDREILLDFLENFESNHVYIDSNHSNEYEINVYDKDNDYRFMSIVIEDNEYDYTFYSNIKNGVYNNIDDLLQTINNDFVNFYEILKNSKIIEVIQSNHLVIMELPIVNVVNFCDFVVYCYENVNNKVLPLFIRNMYNNINYKDVAEVFDRKYKYLIDANKFDLI